MYLGIRGCGGGQKNVAPNKNYCTDKTYITQTCSRSGKIQKKTLWENKIKLD